MDYWLGETSVSVAKAMRQARRDIKSKIIKDTKGRQYRVKHVMTDKEAREAQIYPGYTTIHFSPIESKRDIWHKGLELPVEIVERWLNGEIRVEVN